MYAQMEIIIRTAMKQYNSTVYLQGQVSSDLCFTPLLEMQHIPRERRAGSRNTKNFLEKSKKQKDLSSRQV